MVPGEQFENDNTSDSGEHRAPAGAAEDDKPAEECLSAEQIADVAADLCSPEEREKAIAHFSSCRKCYDAWVSVSFSLAAMGRGSRPVKRSLATVRNLTYLCSAFAVMVIVIVFFNLNKPAEVSEPTSTESRQLDEPMARQAERSPVAPAFPVGNVDVTGRQNSGAAQVTRKGVGSAGTVEVSLGVSLKVERWLADVAQACRKQGGDWSSWEKLEASGRALEIMVENENLPADQRERAAAVGELLAGITGPGTVGVQCSKIMALLAEEGQ